MIPLLLQAAGASAAVEPSATRITLNGQTRIYRTYGWAAEPEVFAPLVRELKAFGLRSEWQPGQEQVTLHYRETVVRWRVARSGDDLHVAPSRAGEFSEAEALEIERTLFLPVRATVALMGGSVTWNVSSRTLVAQLGGADGQGIAPADPTSPSPPAGSGAVVTRLQWSETAGGLALDVEATAPIRASVLQLQNPSRLVIDFRPAAFGLDTAPEPRGVVRGVRLGQFEPEVARLVLELSGARLTGSGLPTSPQTRFTIRLTGSAAIAAAPRVSSPKRDVFRRPRRLASRGGLARRDVESLKAALAGEGALRGKVICIDPGHGGHDTGAHGYSGLLEKDLNLQFALAAAQTLEAAGATVILTRSDDTFIPLEDRWGLANTRGVDLFISIHCNSMPQFDMASGTETYFCNDYSLRLAQAMQPQVAGAMGGRDGGVRRRRFAVVRHTQMPAVLLEIGYINHSEDSQKLADPDYQRAVAEAIRDGVTRYCGE